MNARALAASAAPQTSMHAAKTLMDRRWEERRAAAHARYADDTSSAVLVRADVSGVQPISDVSATELLLEDMRRLELGDQSKSNGPAWLRDTQRAMFVVAALSCSTLLALLYFGGFLG